MESKDLALSTLSLALHTKFTKKDVFFNTTKIVLQALE